MRYVCALAILLVACLGTARAAGAQAPNPTGQEKADLAEPPPSSIASRVSMPLTFDPEQDIGSVSGACEGCPPRRVGVSLLQTTGINVVYGLANLVRGQVTAKVTPKTWWENMQQGMVWDLDDFTVNQIGHPYQGNNYFNAGGPTASTSTSRRRSPPSAAPPGSSSARPTTPR
jgi:hypothetical protein